ncbi:rhomboid family intramembrane serine protease [Bosea caraganae]|uniref:Rhomboid family intramembrane serine protease n=1 Tax=Bosea caraganae TaxID=2763117 RepID=A0A370LC53_9HYPH|nr:rhomboid family intramembrane serine protease [Bosea caraganae]RDJ27465.1 rhomboid family intramembrane serine protease [Bosea caraganae]RDJ29481.1 rhomboid family intramembrane serine protease [Bosea caraganae]
MSENPADPPLPPRSEPILNLPAVVIWLILLLTGIQAGRELLSPMSDFSLMSWLAFVPARMSLWLDPERATEIATALTQSLSGQDLADRAQLVGFLLGDGGPRLWTLLSYGLLHGSWVHLISNVIWFAAFGSPVARRLGPVRFLNLMALATIGGALLHWWSRELDVLPLVGASAAISGAMAAAIRFVFSPGLRFGSLADDAVVRAIPAERLGQIWQNPRALLFILIWFVTNFLFGAGLIPILGEDASIAWEAHIGGFVVGLLLFPLLDRGAVRS